MRPEPGGRIIDISPPIGPNLAVWPGDVPPMRSASMELSRGDSVTLSSLHSTVHLGAHADAPSHYGLDAPSIDARPLDLYIGICRVFRLDLPRNSLVTMSDLDGPIDALRILIRTATYPDSNRMNEDFAALAPDLVSSLHERGVRLIGVDTPSVDPFSSKDLPSHRTILRHDMAILEGLRLDHVPSGLYELIAPPLRLEGFDASPVRALLRMLS